MIACVVAAVRRYSVWDVLVTVLSTVGIGILVFVLGIVLVANVAGWGPFPDVPRNFTVEVPWYREVLLPAITLAAATRPTSPGWRAELLEVLDQDYVRTARAKGLPGAEVVVRHALRNALIPLVTVVGLQVGSLLGGAIITETIFAVLRGWGLALVQACELPLLSAHRAGDRVP